MEIRIRKATEQDLGTVYTLIKEFATYLGKIDKVRISQDYFFNNSNYFDCLLAENSKGEVIGYALFCTVFHTWSGKAIYLDDLFVKEDFRKHSVGTMLVCAIIDFAKQQGISNLNWQVLEWNEAAIEFYKKMGAIVGDDNLNCYFEIK